MRRIGLYFVGIFGFAAVWWNGFRLIGWLVRNVAR